MAATFGTLPELANFLITGYWASPAGGGTTPRQWQSPSISVNITGLTATEQVLAKDALADWAAVANLTFTFTNGPANITYTDLPGPNGGPTAFAADTLQAGTQFLQSVTVNISSNWAPVGGGPGGVGSYLFDTYIHETGHALGLGHLGPYNNTATYSPNGPPAGNNIFTNDTWQWSVMSYFNQPNFGGSSFAFLVTPQMADIFAIQSMYGAPTTSVGNTTYGFNSTAGAIYNFALYPSNAVPAFTIYNTGANNTLDASGYTQNQIINLNPGQWSSIGGQVNNIGIYTTTNIANAIAGSGNDLIIPNGSLSQKGTLTGGSGNDTFQDTQAGLNKYTIANMHVGDKINFTDANLATFTFNLNGSTLNYGNNNQITFSNNLVGKFAVSTDPVSGIDLTVVPATSTSPLSGPPPVSVSALTALQQGIQFFTNSAEATAEAVAINATPTTESVFTYAAKLINSQISLAQVAMGDSALMEGETIGVGNATTPNTLTFFSTVFLPAQVSNAVANGFSPTVYAAEALGLALGGNAAFNTNFVTPFTGNVVGFAQAVSNATGTNVSAIQTFVQNWINFYTANPSATQGLSITQAAYGAAFGDSVGAALRAPASLNLPLTTVFSTTGNNGFSPNTVAGLVANALIDNAEDTANGTPGTLYKTGVSLVALPQHAPLQGEFNGGAEEIPIGSSGQSNSTVSGTSGGAGQTLTPGDTIMAAPGTTGQVFNLTGIAAAGSVIDVTSVGPGNTVSGVQTANVSATGQAVQGDFTAAGPEGAWSGLTLLTVTSGGSAAGANLLTVAATTAVQLTDTLVSTTTNPLTVNGSLTTTITENNGTFVNGGITVNGGSGTTTVSITQTETVAGNDGVVTIVDAKGASTTAAGTITKITLDGLSHFADFTTGPNVIIDNALTNLTVNHSDLLAGNVGLAIIDNLTTPTATTLTLSLGADGVNAAGAAVSQLVIADVKAEYSTIHLTLGAQNSFVNIIDNGLTTLDIPNAGTGALVGVPGVPGDPSIINSAVAAAVNFDFSGLNGPNDIAVNRLSTNNPDVYTLDNFGTNVGVPTTEQQLTIENTNPANTATINFGSGAYIINDELHPAGTHSYVQTAANGAGLANLSTASQWAIIRNLHGAPNSDTLTFATDNVKTIVNSGAAPSIAMGIANALTTAAHTASEFEFKGNTFIFDHADNSASLTAADAMVQLVGLHPIAAVSAANAITFTV